MTTLSGCSRTAERETHIMNQEPDNTWTTDHLESGDTEAIRTRALTDPAYLKEKDWLGDTPLENAIDFAHLDLVRFLLEQGADPNVDVDDGYTCLLSAVENEDDVSVEILSALIEAGADIHESGISGSTPLHMAAARGFVEKASLLLNAGARIDQRKEIDGHETPLMEASFCGHPRMVAFLLEKGADASLKEIMTGQTPLEIARSAAAGPDLETYKMLKEMTKDGELDVDDILGDALAATDLSNEEMQQLKQSIQEIDLAESYLESSKELARSGNHAEVIRILEEHAKAR